MGNAVLSWGECLLFKSIFDFVCVTFGVVCNFASWVGCKLEVLSLGGH